MTIILGDRERLAFELAWAIQREFCGIRLWLSGRSFGDLDLYAPACALRGALDDFGARASRREDEALFVESADLCLERVFSTVFGTDTSEEAVERSSRYASFLLSPHLCESMDDVVIVVVSCAGLVRVVSRDVSGGAAVERTISIADFDAIIRELYDQVDESR